MTIEKFSEQKNKFNEQENVVLYVKNELSKAQNVLEALENEKQEFIARQKEKLSEVSILSADEYVEIKNKNSGLQARIEYYQAFITDLKNKLYTEQEKLFNLQKNLKLIRGNILFSNADDLFNQFIQQNKEVLCKLFCLLYYSGKIEDDNDFSGETKDKKIIRFLMEKIEPHIKTDVKLDKELCIHSEQLQNFAIKSPAVLHRENFNQNKPAGLKELINNL